jgi:twitching motility protein PilT
VVTIEELLQIMVQRRGSDLHVTAGAPPKVRIHGDMTSTEHDVLTPDMTQKIIYSFLTSDQIAKFERELELDLSFGVDGLGRFRVNVFQQRGAVGAVLRIIPYEILNFQQLGLPMDVCKKLCATPKGLILVTGATGSGKSTTMAAMIDEINTNEPVHIITIEDPIEFVHRNKKALFNQREVGSDTHGFKQALKSVLRQDPDCVLVGEMRDQETIEAALTLAETGHLTFGTLHTSDTVQTMSRIVDVFPAYQQQQIRTQLAFSLVGVFCQQLCPKVGGKGRVLCAEIMLANPAIKALIRDDKAFQIYSIIQTSGKVGMTTMNMSLANLVNTGQIALEEAMVRTTDVEDLKRLLTRGG